MSFQRKSVARASSAPGTTLFLPPPRLFTSPPQCRTSGQRLGVTKPQDHAKNSKQPSISDILILARNVYACSRRKDFHVGLQWDNIAEAQISSRIQKHYPARIAGRGPRVAGRLLTIAGRT